MFFVAKESFVNFLNQENRNFTITFDINSREVTSFWRLDNQKGKVILDTLWKNFKLSLIGWENDSKLLSYKGFIVDDIVSEFVFTRRKFDFWKTGSIDFLGYDNNYISILTEQNKKIVSETCPDRRSSL